jgi:hypothetical protein
MAVQDASVRASFDGPFCHERKEFVGSELRGSALAAM